VLHLVGILFPHIFEQTTQSDEPHHLQIAPGVIAIKLMTKYGTWIARGDKNKNVNKI